MIRRATSWLTPCLRLNSLGPMEGFDTARIALGRLTSSFMVAPLQRLQPKRPPEEEVASLGKHAPPGVVRHMTSGLLLRGLTEPDRNAPLASLRGERPFDLWRHRVTLRPSSSRRRLWMSTAAISPWAMATAIWLRPVTISPAA